MHLSKQLTHYARLMRLDKPIGILLLLWPTLLALWLASKGHPHTKILFIFLTGVILMRSAGCILNDIADRHFDAFVKRTCSRPLATGTVTTKAALFLAVILSACAFLLVLFCNRLTISLALIGALLAIIYPYLKRITSLPQLGLGLAFSWGVPMAFAAERGYVGLSGWFVFATCIIWPVIYDTMYAMVDREDDEKIGVKSAAILFAGMDRWIIALLQLLFIALMVVVGLIFHLHVMYYISLAIAAFLFAYQQWLIKDRHEPKCFQAFLNNNWVGCVIFAGLVLSYYV